MINRPTFYFLLAVALPSLSGAPAILSAQSTPARPTPSTSETQIRKDDADFSRQADRLRAAVYRRPRAGATFDLWYAHFANANRLNEWRAAADSYRQQQAADVNAQVAWGLVCERLTDWPAAADAYQQAAKLAADDYYIWSRLAQVQLRQGQRQAAAESLARTMSLRVPANEYLALAKQLAALHEQLEQRTEAIAVYRAAADRFAKDDKVLRELAAQLRQLKDMDDAARIWQTLSKSARDPQIRFEAARQLALLSVDAGQPEEAIRQLTDLSRRTQSNSWQAADLRTRINSLLLQQGGPSRVVEFWQDEHQRSPQDLTIINEYAAALADADHIDQAIALYRSALERATDQRALRERLLNALVRQGNIDAALQEAETLATSMPQDPEGWFRWGQLLISQPNATDASVDQAIEAWRRATAVRTTDATVALRAAELCRATALGREAETLRRQPTALIPTEVVARHAKLIDAATEFYREAARRQPDGSFHEFLAEFLQRRGLRNDAVTTWREMASRRTPPAWLDAAIAMHRHGYLAEAITAAGQATESQPTDMAAWQTLIEWQLAADEEDAALLSLRQMEANANDDPKWQRVVQELRAGIEIRAGRLEDELRRLRTSLATSPHDATTALTLANLLQTAGNIDSAINTLAPLVAQPDDIVDADLLQRYATLLSQAGQTQQAANAYARVIRIDPTHGIDVDRRYIELLLVGDKAAQTQALDAANALVRKYARNPDAFLLGAHVAEVVGDTTQALSFLRRATLIAPRDVQVRKQYAIALREAQQLGDARREAALSLGAAETQSERLALTSWLTSWSTTDDDAWLEDALREAQAGDAAHAAEWSRCLVVAFQARNRFDAAYEELTSLLARSPLDVDLLRELVDTAVAAHRLPDAIRYQQQFVAIDPAPATRQRLANLYRLAGEPDKAFSIWDQILTEEASERELIKTVDTACISGQVLNAQLAAEAGLSRYPDSWQLAYRAALLHVVLGQPHEAALTWRSLLRRQADNTEPTDGLTMLTTALTSSSHFRSINELMRRMGPTHPSVLASLFQASRRGTLPVNSLRDAQIYAAVAWYRNLGSGASQNGADADHSFAQPRVMVDDDSYLPALACAAWAVQDFDEAASWTASWLQQSPESQTAHYLRFLTPRLTNESAQEAQQRLHASFQFLHSTAAEDERPVLSLGYARSLAAIVSADELAATIAAALAELPSSAAADMLPVATEVPESARRDVGLAIIARWQAGLPSLATPNERTLTTLSLLATLQEVDRDTRLSVIAPLLRDYLQATAERLSSPKQTEPRLLTVSQSLGLWRRLREVLADNRRVEFNSVVNLQNLQSPDNQSSESARIRDVGKILAIVSDPTPSLQSESPASSGAPLYPTTSRTTGRLDLLLFHHVATLANDGESRAKLLAALRDDDTNQFDARATSLAQVRAALHWWWNEPEQTLAELTALSRHNPDSLEHTCDLAAVRLLTNDLPGTHQLLKSLSSQDRQNGRVSVLQTALWDHWSQQLLARELHGHEGAISALAADPTGNWLISVGVDATVRVWNVKDGELTRTLTDCTDILLAVAVTPDGSELAAAGYDRSVRRWQLSDGKPVDSPWPQPSTVRSLRYTADGSQLLVAGDDGTLSVWDRAEQTLQRQLANKHDSVLAMALGQDNTLAVGLNGGEIQWWNLTDGTQIARDRLSSGSVRSLYYDESTRSWLAGSDSHAVLRWSADSQPQEKDSVWPAKSSLVDAGVRSIVSVPGTPWVAIGREDQLVELLNRETLASEVSLKSHTGRVLAVVADPGGNWIASAGFDGVIKIWSLPSKLAERR